MDELWKVIERHNNYEVSNLGRVRSVGRIARARTLTARPNPRGYPVVGLRDGPFRYWKTVASLVAEAFLGPRPKGLQINHKDGDKANDRANNLEYVTGSENMLHAYRTGLQKQANHTISDRKYMKKLHNAGYSLREIAYRFNLSPTTVRKICSGISYRWENN